MKDATGLYVCVDQNIPESGYPGYISTSGYLHLVRASKLHKFGVYIYNKPQTMKTIDYSNGVFLYEGKRLHISDNFLCSLFGSGLVAIYDRGDYAEIIPTVKYRTFTSSGPLDYSGNPVTLPAGYTWHIATLSRNDIIAKKNLSIDRLRGRAVGKEVNYNMVIQGYTFNSLALTPASNLLDPLSFTCWIPVNGKFSATFPEMLGRSSNETIVYYASNGNVMNYVGQYRLYQDYGVSSFDVNKSNFRKYITQFLSLEEDFSDMFEDAKVARCAILLDYARALGLSQVVRQLQESLEKLSINENYLADAFNKIEDLLPE